MDRADNLPFSLKPILDEICAFLGVDDRDVVVTYFQRTAREKWVRPKFMRSKKKPPTWRTWCEVEIEQFAGALARPMVRLELPLQLPASAHLASAHPPRPAKVKKTPEQVRESKVKQNLSVWAKMTPEQRAARTAKARAAAAAKKSAATASSLTTLA